MSNRINNGKASREVKQYHKHHFSQGKRSTKIEIYLSHASQLGEVIRALSTLSQNCITRVKILPVPYQPKSLLQHEVTKMHYRDVQVVRLADNTLQCKASAQKIPSTPQGGIDFQQLELEIHLGKWDLK